MDTAASPTWFRALLRGSGFLQYDEPFNEASPTSPLFCRG